MAEDTVEEWSRVLLLCMFAVPCLGQTQPPICPKHIESPTYPPLARQARLMGEVTLSVTVDAEGKVQHVMALPGSANRQAPKLLRDSAVENMQQWTSILPGVRLHERDPVPRSHSIGGGGEWSLTQSSFLSSLPWNKQT